VSADKDKSSVFKVKNVHVKVDTLKFSIRDSKHDFLYKTLRPLATGLVKRQIQKAIAGAITTGMEYVDGQLVSVRDRMAEAKESENETRIEALKDVSQRLTLAGCHSLVTLQLFKRKQSEAHPVGTERHSQFKVVSNKRNSILASAGNPAGWVNRATEKEDAASSGKDWRSEAYVHDCSSYGNGDADLYRRFAIVN
jgi:hypothetical protein